MIKRFLFALLLLPAALFSQTVSFDSSSVMRVRDFMRLPVYSKSNDSIYRTWAGITVFLFKLNAAGTSYNVKDQGYVVAAIDDTIAIADKSNSRANAQTGVEDILGMNGEYLAKKRFVYFNDFTNGVTSTGESNGLLAQNAGSGAGCSGVVTDASNRIGINRVASGSTATGRSSATTMTQGTRLGGGAWTYELSLNVAALSTSSERFAILVGFYDIPSSVDQQDAVYFLYDEGGVTSGSTAAAYWQTVTRSNSSGTFNTSLTQTTVAAATWVKLRIEINAAANSVGFYIDNTLVSTHTATIPTGAGRETGFGFGMIKSIGSTSRTFDEDFIRVMCDFTSDR